MQERADLLASEARSQSRSARRPRARRGELTRDRILTAGVVVLERDGASALSMRRVAAELGTAPMSLYRHVRDKADLVDGVIARALADLSTAQPEGEDWAQRACDWMRALRAELNRHPAIVPLLSSSHRPVAAVLAPVEVLLEDLCDSGFDRPGAARAACEMLWFTLSFVMSEQHADGAQPPALIAFASVERHADDLPRIVEALPDLIALDGNDIFDSSSRHLVWGLRADLQTSAAVRADRESSR